MPRSLSTIETRTLRVPKSTPATMDIYLVSPAFADETRLAFLLTHSPCELCRIFAGCAGLLFSSQEPLTAEVPEIAKRTYRDPALYQHARLGPSCQYVSQP